MTGFLADLSLELVLGVLTARELSVSLRTLIREAVLERSSEDFSCLVKLSKVLERFLARRETFRTVGVLGLLLLMMLPMMRRIIKSMIAPRRGKRSLGEKRKDLMLELDEFDFLLAICWR